MKTALWIVGAPGVGKTTLVRAMLPELMKAMRTTNGPKLMLDFFRLRYCAAGHYTGAPFDGADTVPYNGVEAWLANWRDGVARSVELTVFDGDRFSHAKALDAVRSTGVRCCALLLECSADELARRRAGREAQTGATQNEAWRRGRETKAHRFAELFRPDGDPFNRLVVQLDSAVHLPDRLASIRSWLGMEWIGT